VRFYRAGWDTLIVPDLLFSLGVPETLSVALTGASIQVEPAQISATLPPGDSLQVPVTVHNFGTAPLQANLIRQGNWTYGSLFNVIQAQVISGDEKLFGVEVAEAFAGG